jgi:3-oxoacyl-[acyl-carrier protein] reductase
MANRLAQVSGHLSNAHGRGLLSGEVAIITGEFVLYRTILVIVDTDAGHVRLGGGQARSLVIEGEMILMNT